MKKVSLLVSVFSMLAFTCLSQNIMEFSHILHNPVLYLEYDTAHKKQVIKYLKNFKEGSNKDAFLDVKNNTVFSLKHNDQCNLYMKWYNPFLIHWSYSDSSFVDPRDVAINGFIDNVLTLLKTVGAITSETSLKNDSKSSKDYKWYSKYYNNFKDPQLITLLSLMDKENCIKYDSLLFKVYFTHLDTLECNKNDNIKKDYCEHLRDISEAKDQNRFIKKLESLNDFKKLCEDKVKKTKNQFAWFKEPKNATDKLEQEDSISLKVYNLLVGNYLLTAESNQKINQEVIASIDTILKSYDKSFGEESKMIPGYFRLGDVQIEEGKRTVHTIIVQEFSFDDNKMKFIEKGKSVSGKLVFELYDPWYPKLGTGLFYSNIDIATFGVSSDSAGKFTVVEESAKKESAIPALFLNFALNVNSKYIKPMVQFGIDPTKKYPYFLAGGGFLLGAKKIGVSGGAIWTWKPSLTTLKIGGEVDSTVALENDIKYSFSIKPGWYVGIVYKFD